MGRENLKEQRSDGIEEPDEDAELYICISYISCSRPLCLNNTYIHTGMKNKQNFGFFNNNESASFGCILLPSTSLLGGVGGLGGTNILNIATAEHCL